MIMDAVAPKLLIRAKADINDLLEEVLLLLVPDAEEGLHIHLDLGPKPLLTNAESEQVFWAINHFLRHTFKVVEQKSKSVFIKIKTGRRSGVVFLSVTVEGGMLNKEGELIALFEEQLRLKERLPRMNGRLLVEAYDPSASRLEYSIELPQ
jgi:hypothetical protein